MNRSPRWFVVLGVAMLLSFTLLSPVATATTATSRSTVSSQGDLVEIPARAALPEAVTPSECASTLLDAYIDALFADMTDDQFTFLVAHQDALLAHKKGLALNKKRVVDALLSFYTVGDCSFTDPGHHGTPLQRQRAAAWGADLASDATPRSFVLPAQAVVELFDDALPSIISGS